MRTRTRWWLIAALVVVAVVLAFTVPLPSPTALRDEVRTLGAWAPLAFLLVHALVTTTPLPRTAFTLGAGLLFGPWLGIALCLVASLVSAAVAFWLTRRLGGRAVHHLGPGRVRALERRLSARGVLTVTAARLVGLPFAPLNYTFGVTTVRWRPYLIGTAIGLVPGTVAVVLLGDAVTGHVSPAMVAVFAATITVGVIGILLCARAPRSSTET